MSGQRNPSALADYKLRTHFSTFSIAPHSLSLGHFHLSKRYIWQSPRLSAAYRVTAAYVLVGHFHRCGSNASVFRPLQQKLLDPFQIATLPHGTPSTYPGKEVRWQTLMQIASFVANNPQSTNRILLSISLHYLLFDYVFDKILFLVLFA